MTSTGIYVKLGPTYTGIQTWGSSSNPGHTGIAAAVACCPCDCVSEYDDFYRPDSTNLGPDWYEETGDWGVENFELVEQYGADAGTANACCMFKIPATSGIDNGMWVAMSIDQSNVVTDDEFYLYVCCDDWDDPSSGLKVEFKYLGGGWWRTTIPGGGANGTKDQVADPAGIGGPDNVRMYVCADHMTSMVRAGMVSAGYEYAWADDVDPGSGLYAGVGHNNTEHKNIFDDWVFTELRIPSMVCSDCWCYCLGRPPKRSLKATITGATGRASCLGGVEWDMDWEWNSGTSRWEGTAEYPRNPSYGEYYQDVDFWLYCDGDDDDDEDHPGKNFTLYWATGAGCCNANAGGCLAGHIPIAASSTCDPFSLTFGPFYLAWSDFTCYACHNPTPMDPGDGTGSGYYYIVITEA